MDKVSTSFVQPGVEVCTLHSAILERDLQIFVKLPWNYGQGDKTYPVLYSLDANRAFPLYSTMSLIYETPGMGSEHEIVIAGIGYSLDTDRIRGLAQWAAWRTHFLTPMPRDEINQFWQETLSKLLKGEHMDVQTGGAALFLEALREEVIPFVETSYRVSSLDRGLAGYSYGGLFGLYTLFHAPGLFTKYFTGSPSIYDELFSYEASYAAANADLQAQLLMTVGGLETEGLEQFQRMVDCLRVRAYPSLELKTYVFEGEGHNSGMAASISRALRELYYQD